MPSDLLAIFAILLWASLAPLSVALSDLPPLFTTGIGLLVGSLISLLVARFRFSQIVPSWRNLLLGVYGLFGYHVLLFTAFRFAPAISANLINYLWPLGIVVLAPVFLRSGHLTARQLVAGLIGFGGAAVVVFSRDEAATTNSYPTIWIGFTLALGAAVVWSTYSLLTNRVAKFPTANVGAFGFVSGVLALVLHFAVEPSVSPTPNQWLLLACLGMGPLGGAFYLWDAALKKGNPQRIGMFAFATPLLSTGLLLATTGQPLTLELGVATVLIVGAAWLGTSKSRKRANRAV